MKATLMFVTLAGLFSSSLPLESHAALEGPTNRIQEQQTSISDRALLEAAENGQTQTVKTLLAAGVNPNTRHFTGATALMFAAAGGHVEMVKDLLASGADVNAQNQHGMDALMAATSRSHHAVADMLKKAGANYASEQFVLRIQQTARRFEQRLRETRDFGPLIKEFFAERFLDCHVQTMLDGKENAIFNQIGHARLEFAVAEEASRTELRRHLVVVLNFFHLKSLYRLARYEWGTDELAAIDVSEREYPLAVHHFLKQNPRATETSKSVEHLREKMPALEQAAAMMREHFLKHPPELSTPYERNLQRIGNTDYNSKFWEVELLKLSDRDSQEAGKCLGQRTRRLAIVKVPPVYRLFFVEEGRTFKIGTMLCTEPPCAD